MAVAGVLLRPPPSISTCYGPSISSSSSSTSKRVTVAQTQWAVGLRFVSWSDHHHRFLLPRRTDYKRRSRRNGVYASLFGVGAPEVLVIGVVALLVFGPKGLAEVARNLGKTLRAFQPTIRELQDVSREFRSTLEREIGLDEVPPSTNDRTKTMNDSQQPVVDPNGKPENAPYSSDELMNVTEEQLAVSAAAAWNAQHPSPSQQQEAESTSQSNDAALSGGNTVAGAITESNPRQENPSEKAETER